MTIRRGSVVAATTAAGETIYLRALGEPTQGRDFAVLWVCTEEEWNRANVEGDDADGLPWPTDAITELQPT
jgi:hypothetical protein